MPNRVVVIGGSAGGIQALEQILPDLPPDYEASALIVIHSTRNGGGAKLSHVLGRNCALPVMEARDGELLQCACTR